jgi:hypothetical protein
MLVYLGRGYFWHSCTKSMEESRKAAFAFWGRTRDCVVQLDLIGTAALICVAEGENGRNQPFFAGQIPASLHLIGQICTTAHQALSQRSPARPPSNLVPSDSAFPPPLPPGAARSMSMLSHFLAFSPRCITIHWIKLPQRQHLISHVFHEFDRNNAPIPRCRRAPRRDARPRRPVAVQ